MIALQPESALAVPAASTLSKSGLTRFVNRARGIIKISGEVEILLTSDAELQRLNRTFRGKNKPTDILSFPTPHEISAHHAGDLAISLETASRQAARYGHTLRDEIRILILHGLLHLSGFDHETDSGEMAARESRLRKAFKLPTTLIARVIPPNPTGRVAPAKTKWANGPSHTSLGQRPRSAAARERKRAEGPIHTSRHKPRVTP